MARRRQTVCYSAMRCDLNDENVPSAQIIGKSTYREIVNSFALIGWTSFGGPTAHVGLFNKMFVKDTPDPWMTQATFTELLALAQCLPGGMSTQMSFAIGTTRKGVLGGVLSGTLFQFPGLLLMSLAGAGAAEVLVNPKPAVEGLTAGLSAAGLALIISAADTFTRSQTNTLATKILCASSAFVVYYYQSAWLFPIIIATGGAITAFEAHVHYGRDRKKDRDSLENEKDFMGVRDAHIDEVANLGLSPLMGAFCIIAWIITLVSLGIVVSKTDYASNKELHWFEAFWRAQDQLFLGVVKSSFHCCSTTSYSTTRLAP